MTSAASLVQGANLVGRSGTGQIQKFWLDLGQIIFFKVKIPCSNWMLILLKENSIIALLEKNTKTTKVAH